MITDYTDRPACRCSDTDLESLRALMALGHDQRAVSHVLWGDPRRVTSELRRDLTRLRVRNAYRRAFPWLRLSGGPL